MQDQATADRLESALRLRAREGVERRHETVLEWATGELGVDRATAEKIYALAEEERLAPVYAFELVHQGVGVRELESTTEAAGEASMQQDPPGWVVSEGVQLDDVVQERRLRQSFRRFRHLLEQYDDPVQAARAYVAEPDVERLDLIRRSGSVPGPGERPR